MKKPLHLKQNIFVLYSPRTAIVEPATSSKTGTGITVILPKDFKCFITSKFRGDEIFELNSEKQRLWVEILNKSHLESIKVQKGSVIRFLVIEPDNFKFKHETQQPETKKRKLSNASEYWTKKKKTERGIFE